MTNDEAKFILQSYRHSGADAKDPAFAEALEHVKRDPDLSEWFAEQRQLDAAVSRKLKSAVVPDELRTNILAGAKIIKPHTWLYRPWLAAAACFVILATLLGVWLTQAQSGFLRYRADMMAFLSQLDRLDMESTDLSQIKGWLSQNDAHADFILPEGLKEQPGIGCRVLSWKGEKVTLICFGKMGPQEVHLFVVDRSAFPKPPPMSPQFAKNGDWTSASWSRANKVYVLAGTIDRKALLEHL